MNLKFDKLSKREQVGLIIAGIAMFLAVLNGLVVKSIISRMTLLDHLIERSNEQLRLNNNVIKSQKAVEAEFQQVSAMFEQVDSINTGKESINSALDELAKKHKVNCASMEALEPDPKKSMNYDEFELNISQFDASVANWLRFLHEINEQRKLPGMPRVAKLTLTTIKNSDQVKGSMVISRIMSKVAKPAEGKAPEDGKDEK